MIRLHPLPESPHACPYCESPLEVRDWYIPGMRNLADLACHTCGRTYFGDLLAGQALYTPLLVEKDSGAIHDPYDVGWFAGWLKESYSRRVTSPLQFTEEVYRDIRRPVLLNCLDTLYGHSLLKLLNAQYYLDHAQDFDLILLIPDFLRWMAPDGVAAIWTVDLPLRHGTQWNDWLAAELHRRLDAFPDAWLSLAFSHPHPEDYDIERYSRVQPFSLDARQAHIEQPIVTYIWREDRLWAPDEPSQVSMGKLARLCSRLPWNRSKDPLTRQLDQVVYLAESLRNQIPDLTFAVAGVGEPGGLPKWIRDLRTCHIDAKQEHTWCEQFAHSHVVIGVHGSNMLLPSAHAGSVVDLMPPDRWGNAVQDMLVRADDARLAIVANRLLPTTSSPDDIVRVTKSLIRLLWLCDLTFSRQQTLHMDAASGNAHLRQMTARL